MSRLPSRRTAAALLLVSLLAACGDDEGSGPLSPNPPQPIAEGAWYLHTVDGAALPTQISDRFVGVTQEQIFLDSARLEVDYVTGRYEQRWWTRVLHTGVLDRREFVYDEGTFAETGAYFTFTSTVRTRAFTLTVPTATDVVTTEQFVFFAGATVKTGTYRQTRP